MIELLTRLDDSGASFPDNQAVYDTSQRCSACIGLHRDAAKDCWKCAGTRKAREPGGNSGSRDAYRDEGITPAYVAFLTAGMASHKVDAGMVYVCHSQPAEARLAFHITHNILSRQAAGWKLNDEDAANRVVSIAMSAIKDLKIYPQSLHHEQYAAAYGISKSAWQQTWKERQYVMFSRMKTWCDELGSHMASRHYEQITKESA